MVNNEDEGEKYSELKACYAYDRKKFQEKRINVGQRLIGQAYLEKKYIYLREVPDNYVTITSGLSNALPSNLLIMPLAVNEEIEGLVEIASFKEIEPHEIEFLEKSGDAIASAIRSMRVNERTRSLLEVSQQRAEELQAQEEEVQQSSEELQATQEEMQRISRVTEAQLSAVNTTLATVEFSADGIIQTANPIFLQLMRYSLQEIQGKHHRMFVTTEERDSEEYRAFWQELVRGEHKVGEFRRITKDGSEVRIER